MLGSNGKTESLTLCFLNAAWKQINTINAIINLMIITALLWVSLPDQVHKNHFKICTPSASKSKTKIIIKINTVIT